MPLADARPVPRRSGPRRGPVLALVVLSLATTGCGALIGILGGLAVAAITDAISGKKKHHGAATVLLVTNDASSTDTIVEVDVSRVDGTEAPTSHLVGITPGGSASLSNVVDAGTHWVHVVYASGWRSRAKSVEVLAHTTVVVTFLHAAPNLAALSGSWFGATETLGSGHTYALTLDGAGAASGRAVDGVPDPATGTLVETSEGVYRLTWSDASVIALVADVLPAAAHAGLVVDDGTVGVLQKGAVSLAAPSVDADVLGSWSGVQVRFSGATLDPIDVGAATATVSGAQHWEGRDSSAGSTTGTTPLVVSDGAHLRYAGLAADGGLALELDAGLTPDRHVGLFDLTPTTGAVFPVDTAFQLLTKAP
jgi:hypothetical protein